MKKDFIIKWHLNFSLSLFMQKNLKAKEQKNKKNKKTSYSW